MRFSESAPLQTNPSSAGPSSKGLDSFSSSNGHTTATNGNGFVSYGNGVSSNGVMEKHGKGALATVNLPGHLLYEDSNVDREEFVRLLLQSLRDVGYM